VPLVDCVVVNEYGFNLNRSEESVIFDVAVVDVECDGRFLGCNVATAKYEMVISAQEHQDTHNDTSCFHTGL
jgi:hypothetical protein